MKYLLVFFCLLNLAFAVREKQIKLEDIEKDNLASERSSQQPTRQLPQQYIAPPQQSFRIQPYYQPQYIPQALPQIQQFPQLQQLQFQQFQQIPQIPQIQYQQVQQQQPQQPQQVAPKQQQQPSITPPRLQYGFKPMKLQPPQINQKVVQQPQEYSFPQQYFTYQPAQQQQQLQKQQQQELPPSKAQQYTQPQPQYQQYDLPYISDNLLHAQDSNSFQQYYNPQLLYLQQYPAASTSIQTVVDPKGGIQYVMYLPSQYLQGAKAEQTQTVETLLQPQQQVYTTQNLNSAQGLLGGQQQYQYVQVPQAEPQTQKYTEIQYVPQQQQAEVAQKAPNFEYVQQRYEPKSLLDSYVPSILQVQYLKQQQQQAQANAIEQPLKTPEPVVGKSDFNKNYVPQQGRSVPRFSFPFSQFLSRQTRPQRVKQ